MITAFDFLPRGNRRIEITGNLIDPALDQGELVDLGSGWFFLGQHAKIFGGEFDITGADGGVGDHNAHPHFYMPGINLEDRTCFFERPGSLDRFALGGHHHGAPKLAFVIAVETRLAEIFFGFIKAVDQIIGYAARHAKFRIAFQRRLVGRHGAQDTDGLIAILGRRQILGQSEAPLLPVFSFR